MFNSTEEPITLNEARELFPGRPHLATVFRWTLNGYAGNKLESIRVGHKHFTSREAVQRFIAAMNTPKSTSSPSPSSHPRRRRQASRRDSAIESAEARLAVAGFGT